MHRCCFGGTRGDPHKIRQMGLTLWLIGVHCAKQMKSIDSQVSIVVLLIEITLPQMKGGIYCKMFLLQK